MGRLWERVLWSWDCAVTGVGWTGAQQVAVDSLLRSAYILPIKEIKAMMEKRHRSAGSAMITEGTTQWPTMIKLHRTAAKSRLELRLYKVIREGRGDGSTNSSTALVVVRIF